MGTRCRIVLYAPSEPTAADAAAEAFARVAELERVMSDYNPNSEAMLLMRRPPGEWHAVSPDLATVLRRSRLVHDASDGAFDPVIAPLTRLWRAARWEGRLPDPAVLAEARARSGFALLEIDPDADRVRFTRPGMGLDFGGIGKGFAADEAMTVLHARGISAALIDFGGGLTLGEPPPDQPAGWSVKVRDGLGAAHTTHLANAGVATSGDVEQFVEIDGVRYAHILDPREGLGLTHRAAATVVADRGWVADALATAACVLGPDRLDPLRRRFPDARIHATPAGQATPGGGIRR